MTKKIIFCAFWLLSQNFLLFAQVKFTVFTGKIPTPKNASEHLFLAGDFNGWNPADKDWELLKADGEKYALTKELPAGIYHFKITRGSWSTVECDAAGKQVDNRLLKLNADTLVMVNVAGWQDSFAPAEKKHTATAQVHIISEKFDMPQLGRQRRVWIYLPKDYGSDKKKYPVIYMHDGQNLFDEYTAGYGEWGIDELMDQIPAKGQCIIVGIDHGGENRITEYDPFDSKYGKGKGDDYVRFLVETLKPFIDAHYHTMKDTKHTTIAGSSMGGLISMYAAVKHPEVFGNAGIFSPAFWIAPDIYKLMQEASLSKSSRFYFVCGDAESDSMVADMQKIAEAVKAKGVKPRNVQVVIIKGASHNEKQWNGDWSAFYKWLSEPGF